MSQRDRRNPTKAKRPFRHPGLTLETTLLSQMVLPECPDQRFGAFDGEKIWWHGVKCKPCEAFLLRLYFHCPSL